MLTPPEFGNDRQTIKNLLRGVIALIIIAIVTWVYQQQTTGELSDRIITLEQENSELRSHKSSLTLQRKDLMNDILTQQQTVAIQKVTNAELLQQLSELQDNAIELNKELSFYQNITQGNSTAKLQVRELIVTADGQQGNQFRYRLVMSQGKKITRPLSGQLIISVIGQIEQQPKILKLKQHQLKLRHVQVFNGPIELTKNMVPKSIKVTLIQNKKTTLSKTLDWKVTTSSTHLER